MKDVKRLAILIAAASFVLPLVALIIPETTGSRFTGAAFSIFTYVALAVPLPFIGAAILFIRGFKGFTSSLKRAYGILCFGLVLFGLAQVQVPLITMTNQSDSVWARSGLVAIPYIVALIAIFVGMRLFTRLIGVKTIWSSFWFVFAVSLGAAIASTFLPYLGEAGQEATIDASIAASVWGLGLLTATAILVLRIKRTATVNYANALAWLFLALVALCFVGVHYAVALLLVGFDSAYVEGVATMAPYILSGMLFIKAAYAFNAIDWQPVSIGQDRTFFGRSKLEAAPHAATSIDIVIYTAQLASNPQAIDKYMEDLRGVTAFVKSGDILTAEQNNRLKGVYLTLERYLVEEEPVRKFTVESLRAEVADKLGLSRDSHATFWPNL